LVADARRAVDHDDARVERGDLVHHLTPPILTLGVLEVTVADDDVECRTQGLRAGEQPVPVVGAIWSMAGSHASACESPISFMFRAAAGSP
jgi:hypothetical protein